MGTLEEGNKEEYVGDSHDEHSDEEEEASTATVLKVVASQYLPTKKDSKGASSAKLERGGIHKEISPTRDAYESLILQRKEQLPSPPLATPSSTPTDKTSRQSKFSPSLRRSHHVSSSRVSTPGAIAVGGEQVGPTTVEEVNLPNENDGQAHNNSQPLMAVRVDPDELEQQISDRIRRELKSQVRTEVEEEMKQKGVVEAVALGNQEQPIDEKDAVKMCGVTMSKKMVLGIVFLVVICVAVGVALAVVFGTNRGGSDKTAGNTAGPPTHAPTLAPVLSPVQRLDQLIQIYMTTYPGESAAVFDDQESNQFKAMNYLASNDPARLDLEATDPIVLMERYIAILFLIQLHFVELDESGNIDGTNQIGIVTADPVCSWNLLGDLGVFCQDGEKMSDVVLRTAGLFGMLPTEIGFLTNLKQMELRDNLITGMLPTEVGLMASLEHFSVFKNTLNGKIPTEVGELTALTTLYLGENLFSSSIPTELGECTDLEFLYLQELPNMEGPVPRELSSLIHLEELRLEYTPVTGNFTDLFCHPPLSIGKLRANCFDDIECGCCTHCCGETMECMRVRESPE